MNTRTSRLSVHNLRYSYGRRLAVDNVSLTVHPGEIFGLLGPNGAGKTPVISCIAGLLTSWSGKMEYCGKEFLHAARSADRSKLAYVPQELAVYANLTAEENLAFFAELSGVRGEQRQKIVQHLWSWHPNSANQRPAWKIPIRDQRRRRSDVRAIQLLRMAVSSRTLSRSGNLGDFVA